MFFFLHMGHREEPGCFSSPLVDASKITGLENRLLRWPCCCHYVQIWAVPCIYLTISNQRLAQNTPHLSVLLVVHVAERTEGPEPGWGPSRSWFVEAYFWAWWVSACLHKRNERAVGLPTQTCFLHARPAVLSPTQSCSSPTLPGWKGWLCKGIGAQVPDHFLCEEATCRAICLTSSTLSIH